MGNFSDPHDAFRLGLFLLGTFLPVIGLGITFVLALLFKGKTRRYTLLLGPLLTLGICLMFGSQIVYNGNMLFAAVFGLFFLFLFFYYPVLVLVGLVDWAKRRKK